MPKSLHLGGKSVEALALQCCARQKPVVLHSFSRLRDPTEARRLPCRAGSHVPDHLALVLPFHTRLTALCGAEDAILLVVR
jgi:hypothetical protein